MTERFVLQLWFPERRKFTGYNILFNCQDAAAWLPWWCQMTVSTVFYMSFKFAVTRNKLTETSSRSLSANIIKSHFFWIPHLNPIPEQRSCWFSTSDLNVTSTALARRSIKNEWNHKFHGRLIQCKQGHQRHWVAFPVFSELGWFCSSLKSF